MPKKTVRLENALALLLLLFIYFNMGYSIWSFLILFLLPDLALLTYLIDEETGSLVYNLMHTYLLPGCLIAVAYIGQVNFLWPISLIWCAHIAMDRMLGFGLKYSGNFKQTSIQKL